MLRIPDLTDPRYLDELGWFLYHEKFRRDQFGDTYDEERLAYSRLLMDEVLGGCGRDRTWLADKTVVTVGCGCTGDLATWPAAAKIAVDPLLYAYQKLEMLVPDAPDTPPTTYLSVGIGDLPLLDGCADLVLCRNALDHVADPGEMLRQIHRILAPEGTLYLSVDTGVYWVENFGMGHSNKGVYSKISAAELIKRGLTPDNIDAYIAAGHFQATIKNEPVLQAMYEEVKAGI